MASMILQCVRFTRVPDNTASCDRCVASFSGVDIQALLRLGSAGVTEIIYNVSYRKNFPGGFILAQPWAS